MKLVHAFEPLDVPLRNAPPGLPFRFDPASLRNGLNFSLSGKLGWIDLLGETTGGSRFEDLPRHAQPLRLFGVDCLVLDLDTPIRTKRAAGRTKDFEEIGELEMLRGEQQS